MNRWNDLQPSLFKQLSIWIVVGVSLSIVLYSLVGVWCSALFLWFFGASVLWWSRSSFAVRLDDIADRLGDWNETFESQGEDRRLPPLHSSGYLDTLEDVFQRLSASLSKIDHRMNRLQSDEARVATVLRSTMVGILALDESQHLLLVNHAAKELLNITGRPTPGRPLVELIRNPKIIALVQEVRDTGRLSELEVEINAMGSSMLRQAGNQVLRLRASPLTADGAAPGVLVLVSDETRLRKLEAMRRDFTANVSHELKTPLAAIRAYAETLLMGALEDPDANRRFVQSISDQAERLDNLIHDLLRLARLQSEPDGISTLPTAIIPILDQCVKQHRAIGLSKEIDIDFSKPNFEQPSDNWLVMGNDDALQTIFNNLLGNAIRYTPRGGHIRVHMEPYQDHFMVAVEDNGIGIPEDDHERIFERFYRVEKARSSDTGGTGLGLAIVKNLVVAIGGTVTIESQVGQGSRFTVKLVRYSPGIDT